jgi:hypothetical protein
MCHSPVPMCIFVDGQMDQAASDINFSYDAVIDLLQSSDNGGAAGHVRTGD